MNNLLLFKFGLNPMYSGKVEQLWIARRETRKQLAVGNNVMVIPGGELVSVRGVSLMVNGDYVVHHLEDHFLDTEKEVERLKADLGIWGWLISRTHPDIDNGT